MSSVLGVFMYGKIISSIRKELGLSQKEFAEKIEVPQSTLSYYESGKRKPDIEFIQKLINIGVSTIYLFHQIGKPFDEKYNRFIESYSIQENLDEIPEYMEDYIIVYLKKVRKISSHITNILIPTPKNLTGDFIVTSLKQNQIVEKEIKNLKIKNSKDIMKNILKKRKLQWFKETEIKRSVVINEIENDFSNLEIFVLLKNYQKFI